MKYVGYNNKKEFMTDLKRVYKAPTKQAAKEALSELEEKWNKAISNRPEIISQFAIIFEDRIQKYLGRNI